MLGSNVYAITFDLKGNVWMVDRSHKKVLKLSQDGQLLQTLDHVGFVKYDNLNHGLSHPTVVSVSQEGQIYICDTHHFTVYDE